MDLLAWKRRELQDKDREAASLAAAAASAAAEAAEAAAGAGADGGEDAPPAAAARKQRRRRSSKLQAAGDQPALAGAEAPAAGEQLPDELGAAGGGQLPEGAADAGVPAAAPLVPRFDLTEQEILTHEEVQQMLQPFRWVLSHAARPSSRPPCSCTRSAAA